MSEAVFGVANGSGDFSWRGDRRGVKPSPPSNGATWEVDERAPLLLGEGVAGGAFSVAGAGAGVMVTLVALAFLRTCNAWSLTATVFRFLTCDFFSDLAMMFESTGEGFCCHGNSLVK